MEKDVIGITEEYLAGTYAKFPVEITGGEGSILKDKEGREYIDLGGGCGVNILGVNDRLWLDAVKRQLEKLAFSSNVFYNEPAAVLAKELCRRTGMKRVFFSNSGAEANETAIKTARKYAFENRGAEYADIITLNMSFHGRTVTALSATGQPPMQRGFAPLTAGFYYIDDNAEQLEKALRDRKVAAIMFELVRGEGGVLPVSRGFIRAAARAAKTDDVLIIIDEVQTGGGRCGALFAGELFDVKPDIVTSAKGIGGGLPIGITLFGEKTCGVLKKGEHGSTFGGNPLSCAAALSVVERIDEKLLGEVNEKSNYIFSRLKNREGIISTSGMGLMIGIETEKSADEIQTTCIKNGVAVLKAKRKIRLLPALNIPWEQLEAGLDVLVFACKT